MTDKGIPMIFCVAVFKSKTDLFTFMEKLKYNGASVETVATPKEAKIGCGLSAKFDERYFGLTVRLIKSNNYPSFHAIYKVKRQGGRISTYRAF